VKRGYHERAEDEDCRYCNQLSTQLPGIVVLIYARQRDGRADEDNRAKVRRQPADDSNDHCPPVLYAPPVAGFRRASCGSRRGVIILANARDSTPRAARRGAV
jgi:hypothetical protein